MEIGAIYVSVNEKDSKWFHYVKSYDAKKRKYNLITYNVFLNSCNIYFNDLIDENPDWKKYKNYKNLIKFIFNEQLVEVDH